MAGESKVGDRACRASCRSGGDCGEAASRYDRRKITSSSLARSVIAGGWMDPESQEARLAAALDEIERLRAGLDEGAASLRRDLVANVSHDLRTPLVAMRGYLEVLVTRGERLPAEQRQDYLAIALRQCEQLGRLVDSLFELAQLDFRGATLVRERFALAELVSDVVQKFALAAGDAGVELASRAEPGLPLVDADLGLIERVFDNLIDNALQHTPIG